MLSITSTHAKYASYLSSVCTAVLWPLAAAYDSGVRPMWFIASTVAWFSSSVCTTSLWPLRLAWCSAVQPRLSFDSISTLLFQQCLFNIVAQWCGFKQFLCRHLCERSPFSSMKKEVLHCSCNRHHLYDLSLIHRRPGAFSDGERDTGRANAGANSTWFIGAKSHASHCAPSFGRRTYSRHLDNVH